MYKSAPLSPFVLFVERRKKKCSVQYRAIKSCAEQFDAPFLWMHDGHSTTCQGHVDWGSFSIGKALCFVVQFHESGLKRATCTKLDISCGLKNLATRGRLPLIHCFRSKHSTQSETGQIAGGWRSCRPASGPSVIVNLQFSIGGARYLPPIFSSKSFLSLTGMWTANAMADRTSWCSHVRQQ